jgi:hypothetical protein
VLYALQGHDQKQLEQSMPWWLGRINRLHALVVCAGQAVFHEFARGYTEGNVTRVSRKLGMRERVNRERLQLSYLSLGGRRHRVIPPAKCVVMAKTRTSRQNPDSLPQRPPATAIGGQ